MAGMEGFRRKLLVKRIYDTLKKPTKDANIADAVWKIFTDNNPPNDKTKANKCSAEIARFMLVADATLMPPVVAAAAPLIVGS